MRRMMHALRLTLTVSITAVAITFLPALLYADSGREFPPEHRENKVVEKKEPTEGEQRFERALGSDEKSKFTPHKLNYGVFGSKEALMQISFKYRLIRDWGLYLAFTNLVKWDIYAKSTPYHDINFMPELFYRFNPENEWFFSVDTGYWHKSNGRDGTEDRGWDQLFVRFHKLFRFKSVDLAWETQVYYELGTSEENRDIGEYLGWWDTGLSVIDLLPTKNSNIDLEFFLWSGEGGNPFQAGQYRVGIMYKMKYVAFQPAIYLQYFNGYGEVIIDYDKRSEGLRAGLAFLY
ncbi:MAG: phospholipase A [Deltaproteobacteria bacterium]|nr:phospholipase A [Deltaproteobacteria bacterium]